MKSAKSPYRWLLPLMTLALCAGVVVGCSMPTWWPALALMALGLTAALLCAAWRRCLALMLAALGLGALLTWHADHLALPQEGAYTITGVVIDEVTCREDGQVQTVLTDITLNGVPITDEAWWTAYPDEIPSCLQPGARLSFTAQVYHPQGTDTPGGYDFRRAMLQTGVTIGIYGMENVTEADGPFHLGGFLASVRHRATLELQRVMGEESGGLAAAMLLGSRDAVLQEDQENFRRLGISHLLSVSGYHVGVLVMLLSLLMLPTHLPRWLQTLLRAAVLALYALLTGANPPVIRAGLLLLLLDAGNLQGKRNVSLHLLCLSACLQLLHNPMQLFGASFQMSYGAMLGIVLIYPWLGKRVIFRHPWLGRLWKALALSIAAQIGILPSQLYWFGAVPVFSVLVNMAILALMSGVMALYWLTLAVLPIPGVKRVVGAVTGLLITWLRTAIAWLADVFGAELWLPRPIWLIWLAWAMVLLGMSVLLGKCRKLRLGLLTVGVLVFGLSVIPLPNADTYWLQFSVGEADAALLHDEGTVVVVDTGEDGYALANYLRQKRLSIDTLVITHLHNDHVGGVRLLLDQGIPIRRCCLPMGADMPDDADPEALSLIAELEASGTELVYLTRGDVIETPNARFTVLWPQQDALRRGHSANDTSLVLQAEIMGTTMLLMSDVSSLFEHYIAQDADILKVAHHGSASSTDAAFLETVIPQIILLSCGKESREAGLLPRTGDTPVYSTNTSGTVTIHFTRDGYTVQTYLPDGPLTMAETAAQ